MLLRVGQAPLGWSRVSALVRALGDLRAAGKLCVVYAERTGNAGAWLGAVADHFWMTPEGHLDLLGVRIDTPFFRELLDRLHIRPEVVHAGRYKAVGEMLERAGMSDDAREALEGVVDDLYGELVAGLARGRAVDEAEARRWVDEGPYLAGEALEAGIVDALVYGDEIPARLAALSADPAAEGDGEPVEARLLPDSAYLRLSRPRFALEPLLEGRPQIAVIPVQGLLRSPDHSARPCVALLRRAAELPGVRAVVLRINSPGGDPLTSDLIWRAVGKLREVKPVVASLGDAAASGGYYVAMAANEIIAEPTTLTGSIGVVLAGLSFDELLDTVGVSFEGVGRGRHAAIYDPFRRRSDEERALLERQVRQLYRAFVQKAADGRSREVSELEEVAEGRVWTGAQALEHGLVDALGGPGLALERARALAGLAPDVGEPVVLGPPHPVLQRLRGGEPMYGAGASLDLLRGPQLWCPIEIPLR